MIAMHQKHEAFTGWAEEQGVVINGVAPAEVDGKGVGIVATKRLKVSFVWLNK
jgi:hypothetical protein